MYILCLIFFTFHIIIIQSKEIDKSGMVTYTFSASTQRLKQADMCV